MQVPLLDLKAQLRTIETEVTQALHEVVQSCGFILGPQVETLEAAVAGYSDSKFGIGVSSGTDALLVALMALDVGPGDIVLTTPYSFFATAGVIARLHAIPAFVDIDPVSYNIDPRELEAWCKENQGQLAKVKAIIPVHLYGQCADMDALSAVATTYGIPLIEDAAQAIGASYPSAKGVKKAGSMSAMGCFSFFPSKNLGGFGDGGMVTTSDAALADKLARLRNHGAQPKYYHSMIGGNFRLDALQAAVLNVKLRYLEQWHERRRENARHYDQHLNIEAVVKPAAVYGREHHIYNQYVIAVDENRDALRDHLKAKGIGTEIYYPVPFHLQECFSNLGYKAGDFPHSEKAASSTLALPIYPELTTEMQDYVVEQIRGFYA